MCHRRVLWRRHREAPAPFVGHYLTRFLCRLMSRSDSGTFGCSGTSSIDNTCPSYSRYLLNDALAVSEMARWWPFRQAIIAAPLAAVREHRGRSLNRASRYLSGTIKQFEHGEKVRLRRRSAAAPERAAAAAAAGSQRSRTEGFENVEW